MDYPTLEQVKVADRRQICEWYRFLPSPGSKWVSDSNDEKFEQMLDTEKQVMDEIVKKFETMGGFDVQISKEIGWEPR